MQASNKKKILAAVLASAMTLAGCSGTPSSSQAGSSTPPSQIPALM